MSDVQPGIGDSDLGRSVCNLSHHMVHFGEEERSCRPALLSRNKCFQPSSPIFLGYSMPSIGSTGILSSIFLP